MTKTAALPVFIRPAVAADRSDLERLAVLDSSRPLAGEVLVAERDGHVHAALAVEDGRVVADPFAPTAADVALLRIRARGASARERHRAFAAHRPSLA